MEGGKGEANEIGGKVAGSENPVEAEADAPVPSSPHEHNRQTKHEQSASAGSDGTSAPPLSITSSSAGPSEADGSAATPSSDAGADVNDLPVSETPVEERTDAQSSNSTSAPVVVVAGESEKPEEATHPVETEKVFAGFGARRPFGMVPLPVHALGENAPEPLKLPQSQAQTDGSGPTSAALSPVSASGASADFSSKWGTRDGVPSPGSRAMSPSTSQHSATSATSEGSAKRVPIWMRKGGEAGPNSPAA